MAWKQFKFAPNSALQHGNGFIKFLLRHQNKVNCNSRHFPLLEIPGGQAAEKNGEVSVLCHLRAASHLAGGSLGSGHSKGFA